MGIASSASAVENVKVDGQIKLWYQTTDTSTITGETNAPANNDGLFKKDGATGDLVAKLRATGDLTKKVGFGTTMYAVTTLGLENNLVSGEAIGRTTNGSTGVTDFLNGSEKIPLWLGEAYMTYKAGNTIAKIGRMELDTPLAFTETWNAAPNTFEAAVLVNKDLPNTTLVGAYVSRGNGYNNIVGVNRYTVTNGNFYNYHATFANNPLGGSDNATLGNKDKGGAYAAGLVFTGIPNLTLHPVYYNVLDTANAYWIDASYNVPSIVKVEALYANLDPSGVTQKILDANSATISNKTTSAWAAQVSGALYGVNLAASYSSVSKGFLPVANTATGFKKTKLYTASILSDGEIAAKPDTTAWRLSASTKVAGFDLGASYGSYKVGKNDGVKDWFSFASQSGTAAVNQEFKPSEVDLSVGTKIDEVNLVVYYINQSDFTKDAAGNTRDKQAIRAIASINF
jgi:hypothetical protein